MRLAKEVDVVCATYPIKSDGGGCIVNVVPDASPHHQYPQLVEIYGTGLGFTCMRRDVIEAFVRTKTPAYHAGRNEMLIDAFREDRPIKNGRKEFRGEDGCFFADMRELGYTIWLDPTIQLGHVGSKEYKVEMVERDNTLDDNGDTHV